MKKDYEKEIGRKYGRLTLVSIIPKSKAKFLCKCDCGKETEALLCTMKSGHKLSCGCLQKEKAKKNVMDYVNSEKYRLPPSRKTHGMSNTRLYREWLSMRNRCKLKSQRCYRLYGERGIFVCDEWENSFETFMEWSIKNGYSDELELDRIDNERGYSPDNCRWVTHKENSNNKRKTVYIEYNGERHPISVWADILGVKRYILYGRHKRGWNDDEVIKGVRNNA